MKKPSLSDKLRYNILFENVSDELFNCVRKNFIKRNYAPNDIIVEDGSHGEELFLLVEGRVKILKRTKFGSEKLLALLHPGDFFGELELVDGRPRSACVLAIDKCICYTMRKVDFEQLLSKSHPFAVRLMQVLSIRLRALNQHFVGELERNAEHTIVEVNRLEQLIEASKIVNSTLNLENLLSIIVETAQKIVDADRGTLYLIDELRRELWSKVLHGADLVEIRLPLGKGIAGYVAVTGDILNITDAYLDPRFNPEFDKKSGYRTKTVLCVPMKDQKDKIIGVFQLLNKQNGVFTHDDENFLEALSVHAAIAINNARLYEQERRSVRMEKDLIAAREVQMGLIPHQLPTMMNFEFAARTIPAREVGGDLYDFIRLDDYRYEIVIADVSGKGLPAALLATLVKGVIFSQAKQEHSPQSHLKGTNRIIRSNFPRKSFITAILAQVNSENKAVAIANAGHCYPIIYHHRTRSVKLLPLKGMALNFDDDILCEERIISIEHGDCIVLYSDGVSEAENKGGDFFGVDRLMDVIRQNGGSSANSLLQKIVGAVETFSINVSQHDDVTVVIIKSFR